MNARSLFLAGLLMASLGAPIARAQTAPSPAPAAAPSAAQAPAVAPRDTALPAKGSKGMRQPRDCQRTKNPEACERRQAQHRQMRETCGKLSGPQRQQCMIDEMQKVDCSQSKDAQRCEARKQAARDCSGQPGKAFRQCMHDKMPPVDCSKSPNPQRCEMHKKAHEACRDKQGDERRACMQAQRPPR